MNDNIVVILLMLIFFWLIFYSVFLNSELVNNFSDDFCKKKKTSPFIVDTRLFEIDAIAQTGTVVSFGYNLDADFLESLRNKQYKEYKVICTIYATNHTREIVCSTHIQQHGIVCTLNFPSTFHLKFEQKEKLKKSVCYLILFK